MKMYIEKSIFSRICSINIHDVDCTYENISRVLSFFYFNKVFLTVDSLKKNSSVFEILDSLQLEYKCTNVNAIVKEVSVKISEQMMDIVLKTVIENEPENIFINNCSDLVDFQQYVNTTLLKMLKNGLSDVVVIIACDKRNIYLSFDKDKYECKKIKKQLKNNLW